MPASTRRALLHVSLAYAMCADNVLRTGTFAASLLGVVWRVWDTAVLAPLASIASPPLPTDYALLLVGGGLTHPHLRQEEPETVRTMCSVDPYLLP